MRPKSIATVVVDLPSTPVSRSVPTLAVVSSSSVCNGSISLTVPTNVVLPTPKPPAIKSLSADGNPSEPSFKGIENGLQYGRIPRIGHRVGGTGVDDAPIHQVGQQDLGDHGREPQPRRDLGDRGDAAAEPERLGVVR